jgi:hypothetical protein
LTIELTPDIYVRLQAEAQRQGRAEQDIAQELLTRQLTTTQSEIPLYVSMLPRIRALVETMTDTDMIVPRVGHQRMPFGCCNRGMPRMRPRPMKQKRVRVPGKMSCVRLMPIAPRIENSFLIWNSRNEPNYSA